MVARTGNVEYGVERSRLTGRGQHSGDAALQCGNLCRYGVVGGVRQSRIEVAVLLEVKESAHRIGGFVLVCRALHNGKYTGFAVFRLVPCVQAVGFQMQFAVIHNYLLYRFNP